MIPISKPFVGEEEKRAVLEVLDSGMLVQGPRTAALETAFAEAVGVRHAVATSSGTTALHLALLGAGVKPGDEVITTPFTFMASANSIVYAGARPVFADVEAGSMNLDPAAVEAAITPRTRAILAVHLYGRCCDMRSLAALAAKHGLAIVEDAAQAIGARFEGRAAGSFGIGAFSLYATKNVMSGEGGMITTDDDAVAELARTLRQHGMRRRYHHDLLGFNYRMSDLHAAIGLVQLGRLEDFTRAREANATFYDSALRRVLTPQPAPQGSRHAYHQYTVRLRGASAAQRDRAVQQLAEAGVGTGVFYPLPANRQKHMQDLGFGGGEFPVTEMLCREVFSIPVHPALTPAERDCVVAAIEAL